MSMREWLILTFWMGLVAVMLTWLYRQIKKADEELEASLQRKADLNAEIEALRLLSDSDDEAFLLDDTNQPRSTDYERARKLGFVDAPEPHPPKAA